MPKKTINDEEIALIKAMLANKIKNKDIQFFFNRPDRPVNSGRISQIRKDIGLDKNSTVPLAVLLRILGELVKVAVGGPASTVRRALCRVDELFFEL